MTKGKHKHTSGTAKNDCTGQQDKSTGNTVINDCTIHGKTKAKTMRTKLANFYKLLRVWDGFWSIPLLLCIWALSDITGRFYFGDAWAGYDPSIFQSVVIAAVLVSSINTLATGGIMFTFRDLYQYMYSEQYKTDLDNLENNGAWRRVLLSKAVYFGFFLLIAFVLKQILTPFATA